MTFRLSANLLSELQSLFEVEHAELHSTKFQAEDWKLASIAIVPSYSAKSILHRDLSS